MTSSAGRTARALNLRRGEGRLLTILAGYLFLATATVTVTAASQNGLFLSVYPGALLPWAIVAAALVTAVVAVVFAGLIAGAARRLFAAGVTIFLALTLGLSQLAFAWNPDTTFALYLWLSTVQILVITQAWDYTSDLLTGRQAKRLMPLIGIGASVGSLLGGLSVAPMALSLGTANLLWVGGALQFATLPFLWALATPAHGVGPRVSEGAVRDFVDGASRGFRSIARHPLLRVMALTIVFLSLTSTLIELQYKLALQANFTEDEIAAVYGLMVAVTGAVTLVLQVAASRVILPKLGVSVAAMLQAGALLAGAGVAVVVGGFAARAALEVLDEALENALEKPVEQISLLPFPGPVKSATLATLGGVLRPLSIALGGGLAILLAGRAGLLAVTTALCAGGAMIVVVRHRPLYLNALEDALAGHRVDLSGLSETALLADKEALSVVDRGLADDDPMVVVFSASLLAQARPEEALPRAAALLEHPVPEVRGEAVRVLGGLDVTPRDPVRVLLQRHLQKEEVAFVLATSLTALGSLGELDTGAVRAFLDHEDAQVRQKALVALGRVGDDAVEARIMQMLDSDDEEDQKAAAGAAGGLGLVAALPRLRRLVERGQARPTALEAMASLGDAAIPVLTRILDDRALPLPLRRGVVTTLACIPGALARDTLLGLVEEPALGPAALVSLRRLRTEGSLRPMRAERLLPHLEREVRRGYRYGLAATALARSRSTRISGAATPTDEDTHDFVTREMDGLRIRAIYRSIQVLSLSYDPKVLDSVQRGLSSEDPAQTSNALELLEGMLERGEAALLLPFAEAGVEGVDPKDARTMLPRQADGIPADPLEALLDDPDWWPRTLALHTLGRFDEISMPGRGPGTQPQNGGAMIPLIERVMILKGSQLFRYFPGSDLAGVASLADVVHVDTGEEIFRQGDVGDAFYMVVRGAVRISRGDTDLASLGPREGFGEMALLDREARSATATAEEETTLLRLDRDSFDRLIEQNPSVARGIYRMLTRRLRSTLAQVTTG